MNDLEKIIGATVLEVVGCERDSESVSLITDRGTLRFFHGQCCCEKVYLADSNGDVADLIGGVVSVAEERIKQEGERGDYRTRWTFYSIRTTKGDLDLRWIGKDNGYYSVSVDAEWEEIVSEDTDPEEEHWKDLIRRAREAVPN
jgi:hypothetical protein